MHEQENNSRDYVSSEHEDGDRSILKVSEEDGFLLDGILEQPSSNSFCRKWLGHLIFTAIWIISLLIAVILLRHDGNQAEVGLANVFDTELREFESPSRFGYFFGVLLSPNQALCSQHWKSRKSAFLVT